MSQRILRPNFNSTIAVSILEKDSDGNTKSKDISAKTDIKACIGTLDLDIGGGGIVVTSDPRGEFNVVLTGAQIAALTTGNDTIDGQVEFGVTSNPITFQIAVKVEAAPC